MTERNDADQISPRLFVLIGPHGAGKTTLSNAMTDAARATGMDAHAFSLGGLLRLARRWQFPSDVPPDLMVRLQRTPRGSTVADDCIADLVSHAVSFPLAILDGVPASTQQLTLLPRNVTLIYLITPKCIRQNRLKIRATRDQRHFTPDADRGRDTLLPALVRGIRADGQLKLVVLNNAGCPDQLAGLASRLVLTGEDKASRS